MVSWWSFLCGLQVFGLALAATPAEWRSQSIYFLLTDRFARTDGSTTASCNTEDRKYCGGTWQGIIDKLDYIQGMGFTAIWITPVTGQLPQHTAYGDAYHGYWQQDIYTLNRNYGTADDLKALASALHDRGMYLMIDVVVNHMGYDGAGDSVNYSVFKPFNTKDYFHNFCFIQNFDDQTQSENCWLGDNRVSLPDLDTTREDVKGLWYDWVEAFVSNYSIDGLRVDTVKHVQKDFWRGYNEAAGVYCIGEVFNGDPAYTCPYQNIMDGVLNYPMYYPLLNAFKSTSGSISNLYNMINTVKSTCPDSTLLGTFVENHDNPRFASYTNDMSLAKNVAAFIILADGLPIIYAGQEQHYAGGNDPANRDATWFSGYSTTSELYKLIASLNAIRRHAINTDSGYLSYKNWPIYQDASTIAMRKGTDGSQIITVLSNQGSSGGSYTLSLTGTGYTAGEQLHEIINCSTVTVGSDGKVLLPMEKGLPRVLYPSAKLNGSKVCSSS
ncbi:alpha-amylase A type-1/2 [Aspergillus flavus]|uniref:Alpha-amylase n=1 Tax=Aspergillus flavus TaxID=5059 RepID=A0A5N6GQE0_ASPFL|nr:alpha-amylase A type-1/2 [Aspergillus flavus]